MRRLFCTLVASTAAAVGFAGMAPIDIAASAASSTGSRPPSEVVCLTLSPGERDAYVFRKCSGMGATGGSADVNFGKLFYEGPDVTFRWASGKTTSFRDHVVDDIGACGATPTLDADFLISGPIVKDPTGVITAPAFLDICDQPSGLSLQQPAQF